MNKALKSLKRRISNYIKSDSQSEAYLNYLTLGINKKEITAEIEKHAINQKLSIFWPVIILALGNTLANIPQYLVTRKNPERIVHILIYLIGLSVVFGILRWRFKRGIRFFPALMFSAVSLYIIVGLFLPNSPVFMHVYKTQVDILNLGIIVCAMCLGQSDFKVGFFLIFPVHVVTGVIICFYEQKRSAKMLKIIPQEYHALLTSFDLFYEIKGSVSYGIVVMFALYLQQVDVSLIFIKKWFISKQQL